MKERPSPRNAIQTWLVQNERGDGERDVVLQDDSAQTGYDPPQRRHTLRDHRIHREIKSHRHEGATALTSQRNTLEKRQVRTSDEAQQGTILAERFDLNTPFRHMETKDPEGVRLLNDPAKQRKRHRSSSTSSSLEPAALDHVIDGDDENIRKNHNSRNRRHQAVNSHQERHHERPTSASSRSSESEATLAKQPRPYERRPRHKTKEDKYELKHGKERKRPEKEKKKSTRRQSRNSKTGATLLHDFTAENVTSERLTLRPTSKLGLFAKGRASTAVTRKGLPDLAFSEMTFLKSRRMTQAELSRDAENKRLRKGQRAANVDDEISRFFKATESPLHERDANACHRQVQFTPIRHTSSSLGIHLQQSSATSSSLPPPSPLTNPFLGFGVPGPRPDISVRVGSIDRSSVSPSKRQLHQSREHSGTPLSWSKSPQVPRSSSRPREIIGSMSVPSERLEHSRTMPLRAVSERSPVRAPSIPRTQLPDHHGEMSASPLTVVESTQHQLNSPSQNCMDDSIQQESNPANSHPVTGKGQHPTALDTSVNAEQPQAGPADSGFNALSSETQKDPPCQPATAREERRTEANSVDRPKTAQEEEGNSVAQPQDPAILNQFAADLNKLLGKWKGRIAIPDDLSKGFQTSDIHESNTEARGSYSSENQELGHSVETVVQDAVSDIEGPQQKPVSADDPRPTTNETLSTRTRVSSERDRVSSRISETRSQKSWTDPVLLNNRRYQLDARSPFQDSTYSTCGTGSIYEQQMRELPSDPQSNQRLHRHIEHPVFAITRLTNYLADGRADFDLPHLLLQHHDSPQLASSFRYNPSQYMQEDGHHPAFNTPTLQSGLMENREFDRGRSVEASDQAGMWYSPARSCVQMALEPSPAPHRCSPRPHFQDPAFGDDTMTEAELHFALERSEHDEGGFEAGNMTRADTDEELVGFWRPNRLY
ncbi:hypothetical protein MMC30_000113 [Trapelia coarctata]|nr:hypothetical protein [Trapelia coarctata]